MSAPVVVLPLFRGDDGIWEAVIEPIRGSDDLLVREDLGEAPSALERVRIAGELKTLRVYPDDEGGAVVRFEDALPA